MRRIHHVGTVPADGPTAAMWLMLGLTGQSLASVPDGENTDGRQDWVVPIVRRREANPAVRVIRADRFDNNPMRPWDGAWCAAPSRALTPDVMGLDYAKHAEVAAPILRQLISQAEAGGARWRYDIPPLLQVDVAGPFDLAAFTWGPGALGHLGDEIRAAAAEVEDITDAVGVDQVVFQLSLPVETWLVATTNRSRERAAGWCARKVEEFLAACPKRSRWVLHLCVGDPHGKPLIHLTDTAPLAALATAIWRHWPNEQVLDAVHLPLSDGTRPAPTRPEFYAPLREMGAALPDTVDIIAGLAHLGAPFPQQRDALTEAESAAGRELGVSTPCGMGRRPDQVEDLMTRMVQLAAFPAASRP